MKILLFHYHELDELGGVEVLITQLAEGFTKAGHTTGIVEMGKGWRPSRMWRSDVPIWTLSALSFPVLRRPRSWAAFLRTFIQFKRVISEFKPDIVHVHFPGSQCLPVVGLSLFPHRWRLVVTTHGSDIKISAARDQRVHRWQQRLMKRAGSVTSVSEAMLATTAQMYPNISDKATVIYSGIPDYWFENVTYPLQDTPYILYVGRFHYVKGVDVLLAAWKRIKDLFPGYRLLLVGDGPDREKLFKTAQEYGLGKSVEFKQPLKNTQLIPLYENAKAVVLPSRDEGLGIVLLEAGARRTICIGSKVGGIPEVILNEQTGFTVMPESAPQLAEAICRTLNLEDEVRKRMGEAARLRVEETFSQKKMISNYLKLYTSLK
jgi:glycosyltransferase involved in cell wall biosynthesis